MTFIKLKVIEDVNKRPHIIKYRIINVEQIKEIKDMGDSYFIRFSEQGVYVKPSDIKPLFNLIGVSL